MKKKIRSIPSQFSDIAGDYSYNLNKSSSLAFYAVSAIVLGITMFLSNVIISSIKSMFGSRAEMSGAGTT